jgi:hypothetical protein
VSCAAVAEQETLAGRNAEGYIGPPLYHRELKKKAEPETLEYFHLCFVSVCLN